MMTTMRDKLSPWIPAIFCAFLSLITVSGSLFLAFVYGTSRSSGVDLGFYCFLPMCFCFVGAFVSNLRRENRELRTRIEKPAST